MKQAQRGFTAFELAAVVFAIVCFGGWVANIVKFIGMLGGEITAMFLARGAGIFFAPLGAILGFF